MLFTLCESNHYPHRIRQSLPSPEKSSYRKMTLAQFSLPENPVFRALDCTICLQSRVKRNQRSCQKRTPEDHTNDYCQPADLGNGAPNFRGATHFSLRQQISDDC